LATGGLGVLLSTTVIGTARAGGFIGSPPQLRPDSTARDSGTPEPLARQIVRDMEVFQKVIRERQLRFDN
jgi:hypothetical protein